MIGPDKEGQLKERSEGVRAQWQTALGVVMAAGLDTVIKLAAIVYAHGVPQIEGERKKVKGKSVGS